MLNLKQNLEGDKFTRTQSLSISTLTSPLEVASIMYSTTSFTSFGGLLRRTSGVGTTRCDRTSTSFIALPIRRQRKAGLGFHTSA
mmetsp:Transcript_1257/g.2912  ORF Transcript_1257/g.2912 Transcript_1257/m.2912 type:complete len:85 (-) Transcript_1257:950-1204(-)